MKIYTRKDSFFFDLKLKKKTKSHLKLISGLKKMKTKPSPSKLN